MIDTSVLLFLWTRPVYFCICEVRRMYSAHRGLKPSPLSEPSLRKPNICCKYILNIDELEQHQTWIVHICVVLFPSFRFPIWLKWLFVTSLIFWVYELLTEIFCVSGDFLYVGIWLDTLFGRFVIFHFDK